MRKMYLLLASAYAFLVGFISTKASFSGVTLVTPQDAALWTDTVVTAVLVIVWAIVALWGFLITKYFGNRIISFVERILSK